MLSSSLYGVFSNSYLLGLEQVGDESFDVVIDATAIGLLEWNDSKIM